MKRTLLLLLALTFVSVAVAKDLTINGAEFGIGKFHRKGHKVHPYQKNNAWRVFVLPDGISTQSIYVKKNSDSNYTVFFSNLQEFLEKIVEISKKTGQKVGMINLNAHGLPGGMWFPKDAQTRDSAECESWVEAASNSDDVNYKQYYSPVSKDELRDYDQMSKASTIPEYECLTGVKEWKSIVSKVPAVRTIFTSDAQVHMLSCMVGMGNLGKTYTQGLVKILFDKLESQQVQTSIKLGLGDWSMPDGMGFWGFESDDQWERDNSIYPIHRRDSEIMQKGSIRVGQASDSKVRSGLMVRQDFMLFTHDTRIVDFSMKSLLSEKADLDPPQSVRVPGTKVSLRLK